MRRSSIMGWANVAFLGPEFQAQGLGPASMAFLLPRNEGGWRRASLVVASSAIPADEERDVPANVAFLEPGNQAQVFGPASVAFPNLILRLGRQTSRQGRERPASVAFLLPRNGGGWRGCGLADEERDQPQNEVGSTDPRPGLRPAIRWGRSYPTSFRGQIGGRGDGGGGAWGGGWLR
jgi:hypothetical protein